MSCVLANPVFLSWRISWTALLFAAFVACLPGSGFLGGSAGQAVAQTAKADEVPAFDTEDPEFTRDLLPADDEEKGDAGFDPEDPELIENSDQTEGGDGGNPGTNDPVRSTVADDRPRDGSGSTGDGGGDEPVSLDRLIGRWSTEDGRLTAVLVRPTGASPGSDLVELHTERRVWTGNYSTSPAGSVAAGLTYYPEADEMNDAIPVWARERVEGELEWRLDLRVLPPAHSPRLAFEWHRRKVRWTEGGPSDREVEIVDEGEPLSFELRYDPIIRVAQQGSVRPAVYPIGQKKAEDEPQQDLWSRPLTGVLQHQPFVIAVHVPENQAQELGPTIEVTLKGLSGGGSETVPLQAMEPRDGVVTYAIPEGLTLGDCNNRSRFRPMLLSTDWMGYYLLAPKTRCVEFDADDSEIIEIAYDGTFYRLQYFAGWVHATVALQRSRMERLRELYDAILQSDNPRTAKDAAVRNLRMVQNYDSLMRMDALTPLHKASIGEIYLGGARGFSSYMRPTRMSVRDVDPGLGLLNYIEEDIRAMHRFYDPVLDHGSSTMWSDALSFYQSEDIGHRAANATRLAPNVVWMLCTGAPERRASPLADRELQLERLREMNCLEQQAVYLAVEHVSRQAFNDIAKGFYLNTTKLLYEVSVGFGPAGDFYTVFTGKTIYGKKATAFEYWASAFSLGLEIGVTAKVLYKFSEPLRFHRSLASGDLIPARTPGAAAILDIRRQYKPAGKLERFLFGNNFSRSGISPANPRMTAGAGDGAKAAGGASDAAKAAGGAGGAVKAAGGAGAALTAGSGSQRIGRSLDAAGNLPASLSSSQKNSVVRVLDPADSIASPAQISGGAGKVSLVTRIPNPTNLPGPKTDLIRLQNELFDDWGESAGLIGFRGTDAAGEFDNLVFTPATSQVNYAAVADNYAIWRTTGRELTEAEGAVQLRAALKDQVGANPALRAEAASYGIDRPMPDVVRNRRMSAEGMRVSELPAGLSDQIRLLDIKALRDGGLLQEVRVNLGGRPRPVVVEDILLDASGTPTKVRAYDPKYGSFVDVDADVFERAVDRGGVDSPVRAIAAKAPGSGPAPEEFFFNALPPRYSQASADVAISRTPDANTIFEFVTDDGKAMSVRLGDDIASGASNKVLGSPDFPDQVIRVSLGKASRSDVQYDIFGRKALEDRRLNRNIIDSPKQRGVYRRSDGGVVEVVDRFEGRLANDLLKQQPGGLMTRGQAAAYEAATRELNKLGHVWTDGHAGNFAFVRLPGDDRWKVVVFDPGGIIPVKAPVGQKVAAARRMQKKLRQPSDDLVRKYDPGNEMRSLNVHSQAFVNDFGPLVDYDAMDVFLDEPLPVTPRLALSQPLVRQFSELPDAELAAILGRR